MRIERRLLGHVSDEALVGDRIVGSADAAERNLTAARLEQPDDQVDGRALAGSVGSQIADDLARLQLEAHAIECEQAAVPLRESRARGAWADYRRRRRFSRVTQRLRVIVMAINTIVVPITSTPSASASTRAAWSGSPRPSPARASLASASATASWTEDRYERDDGKPRPQPLHAGRAHEIDRHEAPEYPQRAAAARRGLAARLVEVARHFLAVLAPEDRRAEPQRDVIPPAFERTRNAGRQRRRGRHRRHQRMVSLVCPGAEGRACARPRAARRDGRFPRGAPRGPTASCGSSDGARQHSPRPRAPAFLPPIRLPSNAAACRRSCQARSETGCRSRAGRLFRMAYP